MLGYAHDRPGLGADHEAGGRDFGLDNVNVMGPFVRTPLEAEKVRRIIDDSGLQTGVYMMCEIPSNVVLARDFLPFFDGYSIGSNDLTQTTLGLDRGLRAGVAPLRRAQLGRQRAHHAGDRNLQGHGARA